MDGHVSKSKVLEPSMMFMKHKSSDTFFENFEILRAIGQRAAGGGDSRIFGTSRHEAAETERKRPRQSPLSSARTGNTHIHFRVNFRAKRCGLDSKLCTGNGSESRKIRINYSMMQIFFRMRFVCLMNRLCFLRVFFIEKCSQFVGMNLQFVTELSH